MKGEVLFILAGYSGVGKSTLLANALKNRIPIFGRKWDYLFQATNIPLRFPEQTMTFQEILQHGSWFAGTHVKALHRLEAVPPHVLLHIDLIALAHTVVDPVLTPAEIVALYPRSPESLARNSDNILVMKYWLRQTLMKLSGRFDHVVVNTLYAPYENIVLQRQRRPGGQVKTGSIRSSLLDPNHPRPEIHRSIYGSWLRSIGILKPDLSLISQVKDGRLVIRTQQIKPAAPARRSKPVN